MEPLASALRPKTLAEFIGQEHLMGLGKPLRIAIEKKELFSFILWGPPGSGKTTLARIYANAVGADFFELSAVDAGKEDVRKVVENRTLLPNAKPKVLFIDELHRFNKAQQDYLLPFVERGDIVFVGATTENPSFEVISPLLSRSRIFMLEGHTDDALRTIITRTGISVPKDAREWLIRMADGDARLLITALETTQKLYGRITKTSLEEAIQSRHLRYDKKGEEHYHTISAFIKSMRSGQGDAAMYYLARMVEAGEDPKFIARRMVIFASEDIGLAQPTALVVANAVFRACETVGYPECAINLAHGVAYLSECKKDRRSYDALQEARADVYEHGTLPIPLHLRNTAKYGSKKSVSKNMHSVHTDVSFLPDELKNRRYLQ